MKCAACKYEHEVEFDKRLLIINTVKGDAEFLKIEGLFIVRNDHYSDGFQKIELYACPKCGTVILVN